MKSCSRLPAILQCLAIAGICLFADNCVSPRSSFAADNPEHWDASSNTAMSITGNVVFTPVKIQFQNGQSLPLALIGPVQGFQVLGSSVNAAVYRVTAPADPPLKRGTRICGSDKNTKLITYIAVWKPDGDASSRGMAVFSGKDQPGSGDAPGVCGVFFYDMGK